MKEVKLNNGDVMLVDDEDYEWAMLTKWSSCNGYAGARFGRGIFKCHRELMMAKPHEFVDHIDGNKLNNQKANLHLATKSTNGANRPKQQNNTTGFKGVYVCRNKFQAKVEKDGVSHCIGTFLTKEDAAKAYDNKAKEFFGEFAQLNFP